MRIVTRIEMNRMFGSDPPDACGRLDAFVIGVETADWATDSASPCVMIPINTFTRKTWKIRPCVNRYFPIRGA